MAITGGWSEKKELDYIAVMVFEKAMASIVGLVYTPTEVSTQVVAGTNYCFYCDVVSPYVHDSSYSTDSYAEVYVFHDLNGLVTLIEIRSV